MSNVNNNPNIPNVPNVPRVNAVNNIDANAQVLAADLFGRGNIGLGVVGGNHPVNPLVNIQVPPPNPQVQPVNPPQVQPVIPPQVQPHQPVQVPLVPPVPFVQPVQHQPLQIIQQAVPHYVYRQAANHFNPCQSAPSSNPTVEDFSNALATAFHDLQKAGKENQNVDAMGGDLLQMLYPVVMSDFSYQNSYSRAAVQFLYPYRRELEEYMNKKKVNGKNFDGSGIRGIPAVIMDLVLIEAFTKNARRLGLQYLSSKVPSGDPNIGALVKGAMDTIIVAAVDTMMARNQLSTLSVVQGGNVQQDMVEIFGRQVKGMSDDSKLHSLASDAAVKASINKKPIIQEYSDCISDSSNDDCNGGSGRGYSYGGGGYKGRGYDGGYKGRGQGGRGYGSWRMGKSRGVYFGGQRKPSGQPDGPFSDGCCFAYNRTGSCDVPHCIYKHICALCGKSSHGSCHCRTRSKPEPLPNNRNDDNDRSEKKMRI